MAIELSPPRLIAAMSAFLGVVECARRVDPEGRTRGLARELGVATGERWDVALIQHCGYWSHYDVHSGRSSWPVTYLTAPDELATFGRLYDLLREDAKPGDILLIFNPRRQQYTRAAVVVHAAPIVRHEDRRPYQDVIAVEGDVDAADQCGGGTVRLVTRRMIPENGDRCLRWAEARNSVTLPEVREVA